MIRLSQRCLYGLRTIWELTRRAGREPVSVREISEAQAIPRRFLEQIIADLRKARIVHSQRGVRGGYLLARDPSTLTLGDVIRLFEGSVELVDCRACGGERDCPLWENCVFVDVWHEAAEALSGVYDKTTFADLLKREAGLPQPAAIR